MWTGVKVLVGLACYALACALAFVVMEHALSTVAAALIVAVGAVLVPLALTQVLVPALRRLDPTTGFFSTFIGMSGLCAIVTLVALPLSARGPVARALGDLGARHPKAGAVPLGAARAVSRLLAEPVTDAGVADAGRADAGVRDAGAARDANAASDADVAETSDVDVALDASNANEAEAAVDVTADASEAGDAAVEAAADVPTDGAAGEQEVFAEVEMCAGDVVTGVRVADLEGDGRDEVLVVCYRSLHVLALSEGRLRERVRYETAAPGELESAIGQPALFDLNDDHRRDLLVCEQYTSARGGGRGGVTWWMPNLGDGRWGELTAFDRSDGCGAVAVGDVTGDGRPEVLVAQMGNPYAAAPAGRIVWFGRNGRAWQRRGSLPLLTAPNALLLTDVNGDTLLDAVVTHQWNADTTTVVLPGSRAGLRAMDPALTAPTTPDPMRAVARFDDDETPDSVAVDHHQRVVFRRSTESEEVLREVVPTAPVSPPIPRRDAGAADAEGDEG